MCKPWPGVDFVTEVHSADIEMLAVEHRMQRLKFAYIALALDLRQVA